MCGVQKLESIFKLVTGDSRPSLACDLCCSRLETCYELRRQSLRSEELFTQLLRHKAQVNLREMPNMHPSMEDVMQPTADVLDNGVVKQENAEGFKEDSFEVQDHLQSSDSKNVISLAVVKKEESDVTANHAAVEQDDTDPYHSALGLHTECDIPLDIVKEEPDDVDIGAPRVAAQKYRNDTLLNTFKRTDQTMNKVEERKRETRRAVEDTPVAKNKNMETGDKINIRLCHAKRNNSTSNHSETHKEMSENKMNAYQSVIRNSSDKLSLLLCDTYTAKRPYQCDVCRKCFIHKSNLNTHRRVHTGEKPYRCNVCKNCFKTKGHLNRHMHIHTGEKPYECNVCRKCFTTNGHLNRHMHTHTGEKPYECNVCKKCFSQNNDLVIHMRTHTGKKPYECNVCKNCFKTKGHLNRHMHTHTDEKPYECNVCKKCFYRKKYFDNHIHTHTGEKPYGCNVCKKGFKTKGRLNRHMHTHTDEKPYECNVCKKCFSQNNDLVIHMRTHTGKKPYECNICKKCFCHKGSLLEHMHTHTGKKPYECDVCKKCFIKKSNLDSHVRIHTGVKPYGCNVCKKCFTQKSHLTTHIRTHTAEKPYE